MEPTAPRAGRTEYRHALEFYVSIYGTKLRQLKNWRALGREAAPPDLPPLDDPANMPAWWTRHYDQAVPEKILLAAEKLRAIEAPAATDGATAKKIATETPTSPQGQNTGAAEPKQPPRVGVDFANVQGMDLAAMVEELRVTVAGLSAQYRQAEADPNSSEDSVARIWNRYDKAIERLRKLEATFDDQRKARGDLVEIAVVREDIQRVHTAMAGSLEGDLVDRLGVTRLTARGFVDHWFSRLRHSRFFTEVEALPAAA